MNCPKCGSPVPVNKNHCDRCGEDVTFYRRIIRASNVFYNAGLAKAKVRDLSGAIAELKKSLKLYKKNTDARNLLGLIYYEMGEVVDALSEWVLSKHFDENDNEADNYIKAVQSNPTRLDAINQSIKKYNGALTYAKQGDDDLAIIQLKKVVSLNPHFIRARHLLALLYMKNNEGEKARKVLQKVCKIDVNNTTSLRYLKELGMSGVNEGESENITARQPMDNSPVIPVSTYKEDKPNIFVFINLILGIAIGIATCYFLFVPTIKKNIVEDYNKKNIDYNQKMSVQTATITTLENDKKDLEEKIDDLQKQVDEFAVGEDDISQYDGLFEAVAKYMENDKDGAAKILVNTKMDRIKSDAAKNLYNQMKEDTFKTSSQNLYHTGHNQYSAGQYEDAVKTLKDALAMDDQNVDALYFIGRSYHRLGENEKAAENYNKVISDFPDSGRAAEAKARLNEID